jgi:DNA mismatch repair protein MutS
LKDRRPIEERFRVVEFFVQSQERIEPLQKLIKLTGDLERLISKVAIGKINPREVLQVREALKSVEKIRKEYEKSHNESVRKLVEQLNPCLTIRDQISKTLKEDVPVAVNKGNVIADGFSKELDDLRGLAFSGKDYLVKIQQREVERTGITSLKIGYNNVFGYYLEVTNVHKDKVPEEWHRKQTLTNAERYITEELKEYEQKILGAEEKILILEAKLFNDLILSLVEYIKPIQLNAQAIGKMDVLLSFALTAIQNNYVKPEVNESFTLDIKNGRHPVIEKEMPIGEEYIPNDVHLDNEKQQILIITGPNMSGKSALLRQTALIVLLAQIGSFVPAESATIGLVDKIFTRVGASDNISSGESTFMVEMNETSSILNNISNRSLILLDEIGRGTSTYDGISIAWAISEFLHEHPMFRAKVLFATHYHELNEMAASFSRIKNYHVSIKEIGNKVIFLRKLKQGGSEHSFGIHVAKMAGMPHKIIERAKDLLQALEKSHSGEELKKQSGKERISDDSYQLSFIQLDDPLLLQIKEDILSTDINTLTPVEALMKLNEIKKLLGK